ncbi:MAG: RidA family protein [Betaproteobacteria bacterium]|jgi:enamine deaminase RidA (YjgF/YER057c/UK114 family)|nr:RidA family protein [Betaproteobacteria bacterium]
MSIVRHEPSKILSHAVECNGMVFLAGTVPGDMSQDIKGQTKQVVDEIDRLLAKAGSSKSKVLSATIWLADIRDRGAMNEIWSAWVDPANLPARACIESKMADARCLVEIMVTAAK